MTNSCPKKTGISKLYKELLSKLPSTYPKASLIIYPSLVKLQKSYWKGEKKIEEESPFAFCNGEENTISVSLRLKYLSKKEIVWYYLHEIGHLYAYKRYGEQDEKWDDTKLCEIYANKFANRWVKKFQKEQWI